MRPAGASLAAVTMAIVLCTAIGLPNTRPPLNLGTVADGEAKAGAGAFNEDFGPLDFDFGPQEAVEHGPLAEEPGAVGPAPGGGLAARVAGAWSALRGYWSPAARARGGGGGGGGGETAWRRRFGDRNGTNVTTCAAAAPSLFAEFPSGKRRVVAVHVRRASCACVLCTGEQPCIFWATARRWGANHAPHMRALGVTISSRTAEPCALASHLGPGLARADRHPTLESVLASPTRSS